MKQTILVAGLGLIGGSLAKALSKANDQYIIGFDLHQETLDYALANQIIAEATTDFEAAAKRAQIIFLAAPISETIKLMERLDKVSFSAEVIVSDVSSVKGSIIEVANNFTNDKISFIGGHPMAGSHKVGVEAAKSHLFENAIYVLTPTTNSSAEKVDVIKSALRATKANFLILQPEEHDEMTSVISHFPHLIASSLVHQAKKWEQVHSYLPELAAGGFRDITRIASSNPRMWQDIFAHNGNKMSRLLQDWINEMITLKEFLDKDNKKEMIDYLDQAKQYRDGLGDKPTRGALPSYFDVYVDIKDQAGAIANVAGMLADNAISIRNIRILEIRETMNGALRLSVFSKTDQIKALELLQRNGYEVSIDA